jgi:hypothetical protein
LNSARRRSRVAIPLLQILLLEKPYFSKSHFLKSALDNAAGSRTVTCNLIARIRFRYGILIVLRAFRDKF